MRGKPKQTFRKPTRSRITPADAGKTVNPSSRRGVKWDHPRGCGENAATMIPYTAPRGSPPRMRGKLLQDAMTKCQFRITPADAGKTTQSLSSGRSLRDHPRGCGENRHVQKSILQKIGSPPRMRGKLTANSLGKNAVKDHPRGCGENPACCSSIKFSKGSPPRMRGKLGLGCAALIQNGITPADAGKTLPGKRLLTH